MILFYGGGWLWQECIRPSDQPGAPEVYEEIGTSTSCDEIQETFDRASANFDRSAKGTFLADVTLSYVQAAEDRMRELDCY